MKFDLKYNLSTHEDGTPVTPTLLLVYYSESQVGRYISIAHSIRKWQISTLQWAKTPNWYWWNLAWLTTSGIPPYITTLVGVVHSGWSGQNMRLVTSLSFFSFFYCFLRYAPRSHFLTDWDNLYAKTRVLFSAKDVPLGGLDNIRLQQPNRHSSKIAIYPLPMKIITSNFTDRVTTGAIIVEMWN